MKIIIRLIVLALSAYGAWKLYEEYGDRIPAMRGSVDEFSERSTAAVNDAAGRVGADADDASDAIKASASDIGSAAKDLREDVTRKLREAPAGSTSRSY